MSSFVEEGKKLIIDGVKLFDLAKRRLDYVKS
jgi:hypothetical protein